MRKLTTTAVAVCGLLCLVSLLAGCGPENGALASPPVGVTYATGDMNDTIDGQMGLVSGGSSAEIEGGFGFTEETAVKVSCGPRHGLFRLRFQPEGASGPVLTLRIPQAGHGRRGGEHEGPANQHGDGHGGDRAAAESREPTAEALLLRIEDGRLEELTGTAKVSMHSTNHTAGRHAVSGTFTAEVDGTTLDGSFENCFHFTG